MNFNHPTFSSVCLALVLTLSGCGKKEEKVKRVPTPADQLLPADLAGIRNLKSSDIMAFDKDASGLFSEIFGGTSSDAVMTYLNTRLKYFVMPTDQNVDLEVADTASEAKVGASNIGLAIWLQGLIEGKKYNFIYHGERVPVTSSRIGIMLFGEGYTDVDTLSDGTQYDRPSFIRQATLVHEARHSDCTGGISESDLEEIRKNKSLSDLPKDFKARTCGHLHVICPEGHPYHGLAACDYESWGAYGVGAVYLALMSEIYKNKDDDVNYSEAMGSFWDSKERRLIATEGKPNMTSEGKRSL